jgi:hypothetical protein
MQFAVAVGTNRNGILDRVLPTISEAPNVVYFQKG